MSIAVLTGAGMSTSAGIPDFRGPGGVWTLHPEQMSVYDLDAFLTSKEQREYSWAWQAASPVWDATPSAAHTSLVDLERAGLLSVLVTQNFDGLHERAGNSTRLIENVHGTIATSHCMNCGRGWDTREIMEKLDVSPDPHCPCGGIIKTDVVYFGQALPAGSMERAADAILASDEFWIIGSTLEVYPVASLAPFAAQNGVPITIINRGATQYDHLATERIDDDITTALPRLVASRIESARKASPSVR